MNEFQLIEHYFKPLTEVNDKNIIVNSGDDAAVINIDSQHQLVISTDTLVSNVHFLPGQNPFDIAYKSLMVNVSDIASMGARPEYITLALTLPNFDSDFLEQFAKGLKKACEDYNLKLIGGDITKGPMAINVTILGTVKQNCAVTRAGAKLNDIIMVSGDLGAARLAYEHEKLGIAIEPQDLKILNEKLYHPKPRVDLSQDLQQKAHAAIDISDGLGADLGHILKASHVGAIIKFADLPIHPLVKKYYQADIYEFAINSGDEYELCFLVPDDTVAQYFSTKYNAKKIGIIENTEGLTAINLNDEIINLKIAGYSHF